MELLKVLSLVLGLLSLVHGAESSFVGRVQVLEGVCRRLSQESDRWLSKEETLYGAAIYSTEVGSKVRLEVKDGCVLTFGEACFLRFDLETSSIQLIKGHFEISCEQAFRGFAPQGEITFRPGHHVVELDSEKLTLTTHRGRPATLSTPDVVRHTKKGWQIVSLLSGSFSMVRVN